MNLYDKGELDVKDFCTTVLDCGDLKHKGQHDSGLVLFYASWCGHCVNFAPTWKKLQGKETSKTFFRSYNAGVKPQFWSGKADALVQGYPTIVRYEKIGNGKYTPKETFVGDRSNVELLYSFALIEGAVSPKKRTTPKSRARSKSTRARSRSRKPQSRSASRRRARSISRRGRSKK